MSAQARTDDPQRAWSPATAAPAERSAPRTPLSVVPTPLPRSGSGVAILCAAVLIAALAVVLVMNITMSNRQYGLIELRTQQEALAETNERLAEQAGYLDAPQNLAARAQALGMVTAGGTASVDVATGTFTEPSGAPTGPGPSTGYVPLPADADQARQGLADSARAQARIPGPTTVDPAAAASSAPGSAAPSSASAPAPQPADGANDH